MRYLWKTVNISIHSMLAKYVLAHVSVVSAFFMAACKDSSSSFWMLASVNLWGSISKWGLVIGLSGCSLLWGVLSYDFCITFCTAAHPLSPKLVIRESRGKYAERQRGRDSAKWFLWELCCCSVLCIIHALECVTSSGVVQSGPPWGAPGHQHHDTLTL